MTEADLEHEIFEAAPIGLLYSENRVIRRCNRAFLRIFGHQAEALNGQTLALLYPSTDEFASTGRHWTEKLRTGGTYTDERIMRRADGTLFWCRVRGTALDPQNPLARAIWTFADISAERPLVDLTRRERQVGMLIVEGLTAKEIARRLEISPRTVDSYKLRLLEKFHARNSLELVRYLSGMPV